MTLRVEGLACERGGLRLFSDVAFTLAPGGLLRVRGPNGAGKTTLLRTLAGLTRPAEGAVRWDAGARVEAEDEGGLRGRRLFIGHAPGLHDELTVAENLAFSLRLSGVDAGAADLARSLERLGIARLAALPARFLSQGQRRRTALARLPLSAALPLWLLDEPFASLDADGIARVAALCAAHLGAGGLLVLTSHQDVDIAAAAAQSLELGR